LNTGSKPEEVLAEELMEGTRPQLDERAAVLPDEGAAQPCLSEIYPGTANFTRNSVRCTFI